MSIEIRILPTTVDRLIQSVMSQRRALQSGRCPADLRRLRMRQLAVAEKVVAELSRAEYRGLPITVPSDYGQWVEEARGWDGSTAPRAA